MKITVGQVRMVVCHGTTSCIGIGRCRCSGKLGELFKVDSRLGIGAFSTQEISILYVGVDGGGVQCNGLQVEMVGFGDIAIGFCQLSQSVFHKGEMGREGLGFENLCLCCENLSVA